MFEHTALELYTQAFKGLSAKGRAELLVRTLSDLFRRGRRIAPSCSPRSSAVVGLQVLPAN
jgi:hypothetical protein